MGHAEEEALLNNNGTDALFSVEISVPATRNSDVKAPSDL
jgi:hypothetical protein